MARLFKCLAHTSVSTPALGRDATSLWSFSPLGNSASHSLDSRHFPPVKGLFGHFGQGSLVPPIRAQFVPTVRAHKGVFRLEMDYFGVTFSQVKGVLAEGSHEINN